MGGMATASLEKRLERFLAELGRRLRRGRRNEPALAALFAALRVELHGLERGRLDPTPRTLPVCQHLPRALLLARRGPESRLAERLVPLADALAWQQHYAQAESRGIADRFACAELIGPRGWVPHERFALGLVLLAPHSAYPPHAHPAEELYLVLAGRTRWQRGQEPWGSRPPGAFVHHPPGWSHATRTAAEPLLGLYLWRGDVHEPSYFV